MLDDERAYGSRDGIRLKLMAGLLPRGHAPAAFAKYGCGTACDACSFTIRRDEPEYTWNASGYGALQMHHECFRIWNEVRVSIHTAIRAVRRILFETEGWFCASCLARKVGLSLQPDHLKFPLSGVGSFEIREAPCAGCGRAGQVIAYRVPSIGELFSFSIDV